MKAVLITVTSIQRDENGQDSTIELVSPGKYYERNGVGYLLYEESELTGLEGVTTLIKLYPDYAVLVRMGKLKQRQTFKRGHRDETKYETPYGNLELTIETRELTDRLADGIGHIVIGYDVALKGIWQGYNELLIKVQEERH